jgi:hypothetical protein
MKCFLPKIRPINYLGGQLVEVWFLYEQRQLEARIRLSRAWLRAARRGVNYRFLSEVARDLIASETVWRCRNCRKLLHGPKFPKTRQSCCRRPDLMSTAYFPHKSNLLNINESTMCERCFIYGRKPRSNYCFFCS